MLPLCYYNSSVLLSYGMKTAAIERKSINGDYFYFQFSFQFLEAEKIACFDALRRIATLICPSLFGGILFKPPSQCFKHFAFQVSNCPDLKDALLLMEVHARDGPESEAVQFENFAKVIPRVHAFRSIGNFSKMLTSKSVTSNYMTSLPFLILTTPPPPPPRTLMLGQLLRGELAQWQSIIGFEIGRS